MVSESPEPPAGRLGAPRTAKASRISRRAVKSRCARGWGGWGRLSDDGSRQHNSDRSEDPWGGGLPHLHGGARSHVSPDTVRDTEVVSTCAKDRHKPHISRCMPGAGLSRPCVGRCCPICQPSSRRGKSAVRNVREGRGNVGIIRSPIRASTLPDGGGRSVMSVPTAKFDFVSNLENNKDTRPHIRR